jgi:hypothetical protein
VVNTADAIHYAQALELPAALRGMEGLESAVPEFTDKKEAVAIGSQLAEFSERVSPAQRAAVADCLLLAQLAANKATEQSPDLMAWYRKYVEVLQGIGWTVQAMNLDEQHVSGADTHLNKAIIPVLTSMLGPAGMAASLVVQVLEGLQEMDRNTPWITLFSRASQHASGAKFQLGFVDAGTDDALDLRVRLVTAAIDIAGTLTQVLFFKFTSQHARLKTGHTQLGIAGTRLNAIQPAVADRVGPFLASNIAKIEL